MVSYFPTSSKFAEQIQIEKLFVHNKFEWFRIKKCCLAPLKISFYFINQLVYYSHLLNILICLELKHAHSDPLLKTLKTLKKLLNVETKLIDLNKNGIWKS